MLTYFEVFQNEEKKCHSLILLSVTIGTEVKSLMVNSYFSLSISEFMEYFFCLWLFSYHEIEFSLLIFIWDFKETLTDFSVEILHICLKHLFAVILLLRASFLYVSWVLPFHALKDFVYQSVFCLVKITFPF